METQCVNSCTFVLAGSGNVAFSLGKALLQSGHKALGVLSRNPETGRELSGLLSAPLVSAFPADLRPDFIFLCVSDGQIETVSAELPVLPGSIVCHCSGATDITVISDRHKQAGVFYPLQSLNKATQTDWATVPLLVEGATAQSFERLYSLAKSLSRQVAECSSEKRKLYHLAAVFANNFTNHLIALAQEFCLQKGLDSSLLNPLLDLTLEKAKQGNAKELQTGPAVRNDQQTIAKHLELLSDNPELQEVYRVLTKSVQQTS